MRAGGRERPGRAGRSPGRGPPILSNAPGGWDRLGARCNKLFKDMAGAAAGCGGRGAGMPSLVREGGPRARAGGPAFTPTPPCDSLGGPRASVGRPGLKAGGALAPARAGG